MASSSFTPHNMPMVIYPIEEVDFIQWLLDHFAPPSTLVVTANFHNFIPQLLSSIQFNERQAMGNGENSAVTTRSQQMLHARLSDLACAGELQVAYCGTLPVLRSYLGCRGLRRPNRLQDDAQGRAAAEAYTTAEAGRQPILALLNPVRAHRNTSQYSAEGLSRTFASAIEAAVQNGQKLVIAECISRMTPEIRIQYARYAGISEERTLQDMEAERADAEAGEDEGYDADPEEQQDPWEQKLPVLNVTTRSFGAGERGWVGRTVKARRVAERWCTFEHLPN
jgi:hypothetical protein